jgi:endonuclease/exonuclease/phosphatase family metal-dependent hydrolase
VLQHLDADLFAFQEVADVAALRKVLPQAYEIVMTAEGGKGQNLAVAIRAPVQLVSEPVPLFEGPLYDEAFPDQRDPMRLYLHIPSIGTVAVYVVHFKSRSGGRATTEPRRIAASSLLAAWIRSRGDKNVIVLGDFNDTPDDASLNILETGNLLAVGRIENEPDPFLVNLCEPLAAEDYVSIEVQQLYRGKPLEPIARGAREDNDRLRGKDYEYPKDVLVQQALFDQILVSPNLSRRVEGRRAKVYAGEDALRGMASGRRGEGSLASDHLPVYADIR